MDSMKRDQLRRKRRGFTLLEVLLVVGILVALAAIALPNLIGVQEGAMQDEAKIQVGNLDTALNLYKVHTGSFPMSDQGLMALEAPPNPAPENWRGPYIKGTSQLRDPWGNPYNYQYPGTRNTVGPDVWSNGPDRQSGTSDDIGNWPTP
jgi:general secretion pathway protein G